MMLSHHVAVMVRGYILKPRPSSFRPMWGASPILARLARVCARHPFKKVCQDGLAVRVLHLCCDTL